MILDGPAVVAILRSENDAARADFGTFFAQHEVKVLPVTAAHARRARAAYRRHGKGTGHPAHLSFADCSADALARERDELLLNGNDFPRTDVKPAI